MAQGIVLPGNNIMRSITVKLLLAFLGISLLSVVLIILLARWSTEREFRSFLFTQNQDSMLSTLANYYRAHGTWDGVEQALQNPGAPPPPRGFEGGRWFFTLVDGTNKIVLAGPGDHVGDMLPQSDISHGLPIKVDGKTVGVMVIRQPTIHVNPAETTFLDRIKQFFFLGAAGVIGVALLLAFLLSRTLTRPIRELISATRAVSMGELKHEIPIRSRDELGELTASFNRMNAELTRSAELRRQMTADIAHELRTPMSLIIGHTEAVHDGVLPPSRETFEIIREEAERLEQLIEDLRTLSRADAGDLPIERQLIAPLNLLEEVRISYNHRAEQKHISLEAHVASDLPKIAVDPGRMVQVLGNLVDNAFRYTPEGGQIVLSAQVIVDQLEIRVHDSGPGLDEGELDRIFERFYRSDPSRQRDEGGSGLGLAIARSIIEKHGGRIWAESKKGEGLTIIIHLPMTG